MQYVYAQKQRPPEYSFSPYGTEFMETYKESRQHFLAQAGNPFSREELLRALHTVGTSTRSGEALRTIILQMQEEKNAPVSHDVILRYVKKFEVTRRLHASYDEQLRPTGEATEEPEPYLFLCLAALLAYRESRRLPFLNTALKLNDTLCSIAEGMQESLRPFFASCLGLERELLSELYSSRNVTL